MKVSLVTPTLPERIPFLQRTARQLSRDFMYDWHEWIVVGPKEVAGCLHEILPKKMVLYRISDELIGECRNLAADAATGDILVHIDDDDWQHPTRIERQVKALEHPEVDVVGTSWLYCLLTDRKVAVRSATWGTRFCLPGATLAYKKAAWKEHPFDAGRAEDGPFSAYFTEKKTLLDMFDPTLLVYARHAGNFSSDDWCVEKSSAGKPMRAIDVMLERRKNPHVPLRTVNPLTDRDKLRSHDEEVFTLYVKELMGEDFETWCL